MTRKNEQDMTDSVPSAKSKNNDKCPHGIWISLLLNCWEQCSHTLLDKGKGYQKSADHCPWPAL